MYLAIDYGKKRIGLALGAKFPKPFLVLENTGSADVVDKIQKIYAENNIEKVIVGMPEKRGKDSEQLIAEINNFADKLSDVLSAEVIFEPEAYTSTEAEKILKESKIYDRENKGKVDALSAALLLEQYINKEEEK